MMSKNSIVPFLKDYLIKFLTRPFLLDTNVFFYLFFCVKAVIGYNAIVPADLQSAGIKYKDF